MKKIALITGANKGIGLETARQLATSGMTVLIGSRDLGRGETAAEALRAEGLDATAVALDVADDASITQAAATVDDKFDHLDVLVNNAGIYAAGSASNTTRNSLRELFETNVFGVVSVTNAFLPLLRKAEAARIVNVSSEVASLGVITDPTTYMSGMQCPASSSWQDFFLSKGGDGRAGSAEVDLEGPVPGDLGGLGISDGGPS